MSNPSQEINTDNADINNEIADSTRVVLYDFIEQGKGKWTVQNDVVMGGRSASQLKLTKESFAHFSGRISLENNGGFCSIHQVVEKNPYIIDEASKAFVLLVKGDGKDYNFRVRTPNGRFSYGFTFSTNEGDKWETVSVPFNKMEAKFRGRSVAVPNYAGENVVEMQLLIGNKREETFEILIESIAVI